MFSHLVPSFNRSRAVLAAAPESVGGLGQIELVVVGRGVTSLQMLPVARSIRRQWSSKGLIFAHGRREVADALMDASA